MTWGSGATGVSGPVSATNSLVGTTAGSLVGAGGVAALSDGKADNNYVVASPRMGIRPRTGSRGCKSRAMIRSSLWVEGRL